MDGDLWCSTPTGTSTRSRIGKPIPREKAGVYHSRLGTPRMYVLFRGGKKNKSKTQTTRRVGDRTARRGIRSTTYRGRARNSAAAAATVAEFRQRHAFGALYRGGQPRFRIV